MWPSCGRGCEPRPRLFDGREIADLHDALRNLGEQIPQVHRRQRALREDNRKLLEPSRKRPRRPLLVSAKLIDWAENPLAPAVCKQARALVVVEGGDLGVKQGAELSGVGPALPDDHHSRGIRLPPDRRHASMPRIRGVGSRHAWPLEPDATPGAAPHLRRIALSSGSRTGLAT